MNRANSWVMRVLLASALVAQPGFAQKNCNKKLTVSEDKFTRKMSVSTETFMFYRPVGKHILGILGGADKSYDYNLGAGFILTQNGVPTLVFAHTAATAYSSSIEKVYLMLATDTLVTLSNGISPSAGHDEYSDYETTFTVFPLGEQNLELLKQNNVRAIRIAFGASISNFEKTLDDKAGGEFRNLALCFSEKLPQTPSQNATSPSEQRSTLTVDQILQMVAAKLSDDLIVSTITKSSSHFDLTPETLIRLKSAGVSDAVMRAMVR